MWLFGDWTTYLCVKCTIIRLWSTRLYSILNCIKVMEREITKLKRRKWWHSINWFESTSNRPCYWIKCVTKTCPFVNWKKYIASMVAFIGKYSLVWNLNNESERKNANILTTTTICYYCWFRWFCWNFILFYFIYWIRCGFATFWGLPMTSF